MKNKFSLIFSIVLAIIFLFFNIVVQFIVADFRADFLTSATFWLLNITSIVVNIVAWYIASRNTVDISIRTDEEFKEKYEDVTNMCLYDMHNDFDEFLIEFNLKRREAAWIKIIDAKLYKIERHLSVRVLMAYRKINLQYKDYYGEQTSLGTIVADILHKYDFVKTHCKNRGVLKREYLRYLKSQEYLDDNRETLFVPRFRPFNKIDIMTILSDNFKHGEGFKSKAWYDIRTATGRLVVSMASIIFANALIIAFVDMTPAIMVNIIISVATLLTNILLGYQHGRSIIKNIYVYNLTLAQEIFDNYFTFNQKTKTVVPKVVTPTTPVVA